MDVIRLYVANSRYSPLLEEGRFYVFEDYIVHQGDSGTFAISHAWLTNSELPNAVGEFRQLRPNAVDEFRQHCEAYGVSVTYCFIGELGTDGLRKIRRRIQVLDQD